MRQISFIILFLLFLQVGRSQQVLAIWNDVPKGSGQRNWHEQLDSTGIPNDPLAYNVVIPTLTYFPADPSYANGTSVIICPGGSFCYLHIETEGAMVAHWLNRKGVAAFVLKYRLTHMATDHPMAERMAKSKDTSFQKMITAAALLAIEDGKQAIVYVREHAGDLGLKPERIGIMGFSAGGTLAVRAAFDYVKENRPNFVAPIYAYVPPTLPMNMQPDEPPLFLAAASDDELHLVPMTIALYNKWLSAGLSAELHIYSKGGHGFGMNKKNEPSDRWIERFGEWLETNGFLKK